MIHEPGDLLFCEPVVSVNTGDLNLCKNGCTGPVRPF